MSKGSKNYFAGVISIVHEVGHGFLFFLSVCQLALLFGIHILVDMFLKSQKCILCFLFDLENDVYIHQYIKVAHGVNFY